MTNTSTLLENWKKYRDENPLQTPSKVQSIFKSVLTTATKAEPIKGIIKPRQDPPDMIAWKKYRDENPLQTLQKPSVKAPVFKPLKPIGFTKAEPIKEKIKPRQDPPDMIAWKKYRDENPLQIIERPEWMKTPEGIEAQIGKQIYEKYGPLKPIDFKKAEYVKEKVTDVDELKQGVTSPSTTEGVKDIVGLTTEQKQARAYEMAKAYGLFKPLLSSNPTEDLKEQPGTSQIPLKIIAVAGAVILAFILLLFGLAGAMKHTD